MAEVAGFGIIILAVLGANKMAQVQGKAIDPHSRYVAIEASAKDLFILRELEPDVRDETQTEKDWLVKINSQLARRIRSYGDKSKSFKDKVEELIILGFSVKK